MLLCHFPSAVRARCNEYQASPESWDPLVPAPLRPPSRPAPRGGRRPGRGAQRPFANQKNRRAQNDLGRRPSTPQKRGAVDHAVATSPAYRSRAGSSGSLQAGSRLVAFVRPRPVSATPFWACEAAFSPSFAASTRRASEFDVRVLRRFAGFWRAPHHYRASSLVLEHHRSAQVLFGVVHAVPNHPRLPVPAQAAAAYDVVARREALMFEIGRVSMTD